MKIRNFLSVLFIVFAVQSFAADSKGASQGFSIGYDVGSIANGMAMGARVGSPTFFHDIFRVTAKAHLGFAQNVIPEGKTEAKWPLYGLYRLGLQGGVFIPNLPIRIMSSAEIAVVTPQSTIASKKAIIGMAGGMDIEFFMDSARSHALVLNMGGIGLFSPSADNLQGHPTFANGFMTSFGYRFYL